MFTVDGSDLSGCETMDFMQWKKTVDVVPQPLKDNNEHFNSILDRKTHACFKLTPVWNNEKSTSVVSYR